MILAEYFHAEVADAASEFAELQYLLAPFFPLPIPQTLVQRKRLGTVQPLAIPQVSELDLKQRMHQCSMRIFLLTQTISVHLRYPNPVG